jgi:arsenate reductase
VLRAGLLHVNAFRVLVLCTGNSARSQIGEALFATRGAHRAAGVVTAASAGSRPALRVNPLAIETLARHGIAWSAGVPLHMDAFAGQSFDLVVTVCDHARDACPFFPGARAQVHWGLPDPAEHEDEIAARAAFESTYQALSASVDALLALPLETMSDAALTTAASDPLVFAG